MVRLGTIGIGSAVGAQMSERRVVVRSGPSAGWRLRLMQGFELTREGRPVSLPVTAQRVLAFLAVTGRPLMREYVAGVLWPDSTEAHASGSLRSALWRLHGHANGTIVSAGPTLSLALRVQVDFHQAIDRAHRLLDAGATDLDVDGPGAGDDLDSVAYPQSFSFELLPDWYDEWLVSERERLRQLQLHALEQMSARLRCRQSYGQAVEAAQLAIAFEPTRESARRALIEAHIAEGNLAAAIREFMRFRDLLERELGVEPSPMITALLPASHASDRFS